MFAYLSTPTSQVRSFPPLRPLVLVLKTYLKAANLNDVASGGLSSYSLTNMAIAHLQVELKARRLGCSA
jgi:non-canonical poly(A) RNA polymerase PAPD5/7